MCTFVHAPSRGNELKRDVRRTRNGNSPKRRKKKNEPCCSSVYMQCCVLCVCVSFGRMFSHLDTHTYCRYIYINTQHPITLGRPRNSSEREWAEFRVYSVTILYCAHRNKDTLSNFFTKQYIYMYMYKLAKWQCKVAQFTSMCTVYYGFPHI